jgi:hypothetical protein
MVIECRRRKKLMSVHASDLKTPHRTVLMRTLKVHLPEPVQSHFDSLMDMVRKTCTDEQILDACSQAVAELTDVYRNLRYFKTIKVVEVGQGTCTVPNFCDLLCVHSRAFSPVWRWPAAISPKIPGLIRDGNTAALISTSNAPSCGLDTSADFSIVLAHFAAATCTVKGSWYAREWGEYTMVRDVHEVCTDVMLTVDLSNQQGIINVLSEDSQHWLEWPRRHMTDDLAILLT